MKKYCFLFFVVFISNFIYAIKYEYKSMNDWNSWNLIHCDTLSNSGSVRILYIVDDEFNAAPLNSKWKWDNADRGDYSRGYCNFDQNPGYLTIIIWPPEDKTQQPLSEWWGNIDTAPKIYQQIDFKDDFTIETLTYLPSSPNNDNEHHGIFVRQDSLNAINMTYGVDNQNPQIESFFIKQGTNDRTLMQEVPSYLNPPMYFMIDKHGQTVTTFYRNSTFTAWSIPQTYTAVDFKNCYVGLYLKDTTVRGAFANFDYFHYYGQKTFTAASLSKIIDLGIIPISKGVIKWLPNIPNSDCHVLVSTQTSEDGINWTEHPVYYDETNHEDTPFLSINRRYVKINVELKTADYNVTPEIAYLSLEFPDTYGNSDTVIDDAHIKIYPTISKGNFFIDYNPTKPLKSINFTIKDSGGIVIKSFDASPGDTKVNFTLNAVNGVYFVFVTAKASTGEEKKIIKKIVIKK